MESEILDLEMRVLRMSNHRLRLVMQKREGIEIEQIINSSMSIWDDQNNRTNIRLLIIIIVIN